MTIEKMKISEIKVDNFKIKVEARNGTIMTKKFKTKISFIKNKKQQNMISSDSLKIKHFFAFKSPQSLI